jgi:hypothetical protein
VEDVLEMMDAAGTRAYVQETAEIQGRAALEPLQGLDLSPAALHQVKALAEFFVTRVK